jgi:hypothetical protein
MHNRTIFTPELLRVLSGVFCGSTDERELIADAVRSLADDLDLLDMAATSNEPFTMPVDKMQSEITRLAQRARAVAQLVAMLDETCGRPAVEAGTPAMADS